MCFDIFSFIVVFRISQCFYQYFNLNAYMLAIVPGSSREELMVMTVTEIVNQLIQAHNQGKDVNLNR